MTDPRDRPTTEVFAEADHARLEAEILRQQGIQDASANPLEASEPPTEHVLDRRVMVKWASITLLIYIAVRMIMGPVKDAVIEAVQTEIENQAKPVIIVHPPTPPIPAQPAPPAEPPAPTGAGPGGQPPTTGAPTSPTAAPTSPKR
jgi:hypothetical protein